MLTAARTPPTTIGVFRGISDGELTVGSSSSIIGVSSTGPSSPPPAGVVVGFLGTLNTVKYPSPEN